MERLRHAEDTGLIGARTHHALLGVAKRMFYPKRSWPNLLECAAALGLPGAELAALSDFIRREAPNIKRDDALTLLRRIAAECAVGIVPHHPNFYFEETDAWQKLRRLEVIVNDAQTPCDQIQLDDKILTAV